MMNEVHACAACAMHAYIRSRRDVTVRTIIIYDSTATSHARILLQLACAAAYSSVNLILFCSELTEDLLILGLIMEAQPPPYPADPSTGYPPPQQQPGYPDPAVQQAAAGYPAQGYAPQTDFKPVDAYGQSVVTGGYPQQPPGAYGQPVMTGGYPQQPPGYTAHQQATTVSSCRVVQ